MKERMKEKMKRREKKEKMIFFFQKMFQDPRTHGRFISPFFFESSESDRFFNYLHDSNSIFRAGGMKSERVSGGTVPPWKSSASISN